MLPSVAFLAMPSIAATPPKNLLPAFAAFATLPSERGRLECVIGAIGGRTERIYRELT